MKKTTSAKRAGRKRTARLRAPCGRLSRTLREDIGAATPTAIVRLVRESLRGCADELFGSPIGRLFLDGKLSAAEFEAGKRWDRLIRRYRLAIGAPSPDPKSASFLFVDVSASWSWPDVESEPGRIRTQIDREIVAAFRAAHATVSQLGRPIEMAMRRLCEGAGELPPGGEALTRAKRGLASLAQFWGLESRRRTAS
jgi:hypothetical protein